VPPSSLIKLFRSARGCADLGLTSYFLRVATTRGEAEGGSISRPYLLAIDGGGVRGIIPVVALAKLEATTGRLVHVTFSFVAGTSTGAIIDTTIAAGVPAARIVSLYLDRAREVFTGPPLVNTLQGILFGSMYSTQKLHDLIAEELGPPARDRSLNDSLVDLLITAKGVWCGKPWYFVQDNPHNSRCTGRLGLVDCATAYLRGNRGCIVRI
jgi:patatin-like phospholipase/acyl hydrolase